MARYDYECPNCGHLKEVEHGMTERVDIWCRRCHSKMRKKISPTNFQLRGKGWFKDGY